MTDSNTQIYEIFIRTSAERLWRALIDPAFTQRYFHGQVVTTTGEKGASLTHAYPDGRVSVVGEILESAPPHRLVHTWNIRYDAALSNEPSVVTWEIEQRGTLCKLTVRHELSRAPTVAKRVSDEGWSVVISGLKTLLETGEPLDFGGA
jgi:uncharacterized protein YndB with AHSA1/START domain